MVEKDKKIGLPVILVLSVVFIFVLFFGIRGFLERTRVSVMDAEIISSEETEEEIKYLIERLKAKLVLEFEFREKAKKELIAEITEIRRELGEIKTEKVREFFQEDREELEREFGELEKILKGEFSDEGDRQLRFIEKVAEYSAKERIGYFISRVAFPKDEEKLEKFGVFLLNGTEILTQETKDKVNVFLGGEAGVGMTTEDLEKISLKEGEIFSVEKGTGRKIRIGEGLGELFREGKLKAVKTDFLVKEVKTTEIALRGKATWDLEGELGARGITGLVGEAYIKNSLPETLRDSLKRLEKNGEKEAEEDAGTARS